MQGNADYLMLENLDYSNKELVQEVYQWGEWITDELDLNGFRLDAVQHYSWHFANDWAQHLRDYYGEHLLIVGEFWNGDVRVLDEWLDHMSPWFKLYDVPLLYNIARLSWFKAPDMRQVFDNTLVKSRPKQAIVSSRVTLPTRSVLTSARRLLFESTILREGKKWTRPSTAALHLTHTLSFYFGKMATLVSFSVTYTDLVLHIQNHQPAGGDYLASFSRESFTPTEHRQITSREVTA